MAGLAFILSIILLAATGAFFVAREAYASQPWAYRLCGIAAMGCEHPEWIAFAAIFMVLVYFVLRAREA